MTLDNAWRITALTVAKSAMWRRASSTRPTGVRCAMLQCVIPYPRPRRCHAVRKSGIPRRSWRVSWSGRSCIKTRVIESAHHGQVRFLLGLCSRYGGGAYAKSFGFTRKVSTKPKPFGWRLPPPTSSGSTNLSGRFEQDYRASAGRDFLTGQTANTR